MYNQYIHLYWKNTDRHRSQRVSLCKLVAKSGEPNHVGWRDKKSNIIKIQVFPAVDFYVGAYLHIILLVLRVCSMQLHASNK
jgi:hypothetical protein